MPYKVTLKGNRKIWLTKSLLKATENFRATERKREKFAGNASAEIWEGERKVEEMLLNWGKEKKKKGALYI